VLQVTSTDSAALHLEALESTVHVNGSSDQPSYVKVSPSDAAYMLHTSGTTSRPKLVPISHGAVIANAVGMVEAYGLTSDDVAVHVLPFFHVAGIVVGLIPTIAAGGSVVVSPVFDPLTFPQLLREERITWFTAVPTIFKSLLEHKGIFALEHGNFGGPLRFVRSGAAAMAASDVDQLVNLLGVPFIDSYGMTETAGGVFSTLPELRKPVNTVGVPIAHGLRVKVRGPKTLSLSSARLYVFPICVELMMFLFRVVNRFAMMLVQRLQRARLEKYASRKKQIALTYSYASQWETRVCSNYNS